MATPCCTNRFDIVAISARSGTFSRSPRFRGQQLAAITGECRVLGAADGDNACERCAASDADLVHRLVPRPHPTIRGASGLSISGRFAVAGTFTGKRFAAQAGGGCHRIDGALILRISCAGLLLSAHWILAQSARKPVCARHPCRLFARGEVGALSHAAMQQKSRIAVKRSGVNAETCVPRQDHGDHPFRGIFSRLFGMHIAPSGNAGAIALDRRTSLCPRL